MVILSTRILITYLLEAPARPLRGQRHEVDRRCPMFIVYRMNGLICGSANGGRRPSGERMLLGCGNLRLKLGL